MRYYGMKTDYLASANSKLLIRSGTITISDLMRVIFVLFVCSIIGTVNAQHICDLSANDELLVKKRLLENRELLQNGIITIPEGTHYVPLRFHDVGDDQGNDRFEDIIQLFAVLCELNYLFRDTDIQFYHDGYISELNSSDILYSWVTHHKISGLQANSYLENHRDAFNILLIKDLAIPHMTTGSYSFIHDYIVLDREYIHLQGAKSLAHFIGHAFTINHPYYGWGQAPAPNVPAPKSTDLNLPVEYVNRDKLDSLGKKICEYAADGFCDTPADYYCQQNRMISQFYICPYNGPIYLDPAGDTLTPDVSNFMNINDTCRPTITAEQSLAMIADINSPRRSQTQKPFTPSGVVGTILPLHPAEGARISSDTLTLDWEDAPNASSYILEFSDNRSFIHSKQHYTHESRQFIKDLKPNSKYYWRVYSINSSEICLQHSKSFTFNTPPSTITHTPINKFNYRAFSIGDRLNIHVYRPQNNIRKIDIIDVHGRIIDAKFINDGNSENIYVEFQKPLPGLYFLNILPHENDAQIFKLRIN